MFIYTFIRINPQSTENPMTETASFSFDPQQSIFGSRQNFNPILQSGPKKFGAPFQDAQNSDVSTFGGLRPGNFENNLSSSGKLGSAFDDFSQVSQNNLEQFGKTSPAQEVSRNNFNLPSKTNVGSQFPFPQTFTTNSNNLKQPSFGAPFGKSPQVIGPQNNPDFNTVDTDVEVFSKVNHTLFYLIIFEFNLII